YAVELAAGQRCINGLWNHSAIHIRYISCSILTSQYLCNRESSQACGSLAGTAFGRGERRALGFRSGQAGQIEAIRAAFDNGSLEQIPGQRGNKIVECAEPAGRFAEDGYIVWVAPKRIDISFHPLKRQLLIHDAVVA